MRNAVELSTLSGSALRAIAAGQSPFPLVIAEQSIEDQTTFFAFLRQHEPLAEMAKEYLAHAGKTELLSQLD
jgi:hypothetical protein